MPPPLSFKRSGLDVIDSWSNSGAELVSFKKKGEGCGDWGGR